MSRIKLIQIISEIKNLDANYDKAAHYLSTLIKNAGAIDLSKDIPGYKYGAYSYESWYELGATMAKFNIPEGDDVVESGEKFLKELEKFKLIYIEW